MPSSTNLNIVAMALSAFSEDKNSTWRELCLKSNVLNENGIHSHTIFKKPAQKLCDEGNLAGFLLTGTSLEGIIQLLHRHLEITGDLQSCSLIAIRTLSPKLLQENKVQIWIKSYRGLLDAWKMWN